jgi:chromosome segregation protein
MKLKRLVAQGFKSFKDKTIINFDTSITGIVGPNGCGKSNIVDALFWVMGEQSAKHLRGSTMKDIIFSGSTKYGPASWAEVSLVLENDSGKYIHIGDKVVNPQEIALTRRLYRNGESDFRINNLPCRLKDIQEVFMDTGAGAKSYSIIAQGEINKLVQAKPPERRVMIEEVAGITKFKMRKKESQKKMELTQGNLLRLTDLKTEVHQGLKNLQKQAESAHKAQQLQSKICDLEINIGEHQLHDLLKDFRHFRDIKNKGTDELAHNLSEKSQLDADLSKENLEKTELMEKLESSQNLYNEESKELSRIEERSKNSQKTLNEKKISIQNNKKDIENLKKDLNDIRVKKEKFNSELSQLNINPIDEDFLENLKFQVEELQDKKEEKQELFDEKRVSLDSLKENLRKLEFDLEKNHFKREEIGKQLHDISEESEKIEKECHTLSQDADSRKLKGEELVARIQGLQEKLKPLTLKRDDLGTEIIVCEKELQEKTKNVLVLESRVASLKEFQTAQKAQGGQHKLNSNKELVKENFQILGKLIQCDEIYTKPLTQLLQNHLEDILGVEDRNSLKLHDFKTKYEVSWIDLIKETNLNQGHFENEGIIPINQILKIKDQKFENALLSFVDGFYLFNGNKSQNNSIDIEGFKKAVEELLIFKKENGGQGFKFKGIVDITGDLLYLFYENFGVWSFTPETFSKEQKDKIFKDSIIAQNNEIQKLSDNLKVDIQLKEKLQIQSQELKKLQEDIKKELNFIYEDLNQSKIQLGSIQLSSKGNENTQNLLNKKFIELREKKNELSKNSLNFAQLDEKIKLERDLNKEKLSHLKDEFDSIQEEFDEVKHQFDLARETLLTKQSEKKSFDLRLKTLQGQILDQENLENKENHRLSLTTENSGKLEIEIEELNLSINQLNDNLKTLVNSLKEKEKELKIHKDHLNHLTQQMKDRETKLSKAQQKINYWEKELVVTNMKCEQIITDEEILVRDIFEKYKINIRVGVGHYFNITDAEWSEFKTIDFGLLDEGAEIVKKSFAKKTPKEIGNIQNQLKTLKDDYKALGDINWSALKEYERQKKRFDFLVDQENELNQSLQDLQTAINHIDQKSLIRFSDAFHDVNERFSKVFPLLFGGGEAKLMIVGKLDDPECGIDIMVRPPGKKMQNINLLSGGEKALTAMALIFSIFLVRPSPFCLLDEVDAPLDDANVGRFNNLLKEMSSHSQFILITHNKKTMELNDVLYGITMQEPGVSKAVSVQLH